MENVEDLIETERVLGIHNRIKKENILFRTTLDIDTTDKEILKHIENKIIFQCPINRFFKMNKKPSKSKGYHFILYCLEECSICRLVFDDSRRFMFDQYRPYWARDILFNKNERLDE